MKFQEATAAIPYTKLAVYGPAGAGKSLVGLSAPGKKLVIDTEGGTIPYASLTKFQVMHTQSFGDIKTVIDDLYSNPPTEETSLIIDSGTIIWAGLQQAMLEKKLTKEGIKVMEGTEKAMLNQADWGVLKRWNSDIMNTLMALKCHVICTFREAEVMDEDFKKTGEFRAQWEKNSPYVFDFVGRLNADRIFAFTKGRLAIDGKIVDLMGKKVQLPTIVDGADLSKLWGALFGVATEAKPKDAHPVAKSNDSEALNKDPESLRIAKEIRSKLLPHAGISNEDAEFYLSKKVTVDGEHVATLDGEGKIHLSSIKPKHLNWFADILVEPAKVEQLKAKIAEMKAGAK